MARGIETPTAEWYLPGTCVPATHHSGPSVVAVDAPSGWPVARRRETSLRAAYLETALAAIPRVLGSMDRNPYRPTYGCMDREHWHYRTSSFPSEMYQEAVLPLAMVWATRLPGNPYFGSRRIAELAAAGIRFAARSSRADGSCDDYYPFERALGAAVFSLAACAEAYRLLGLHEPELLDWLRRRARWIMANGESGHLTNHHALAALGLVRVAQITGQDEFRHAANAKIDQVLAWQDEEGWFDEYGGADPGYQTVTIDCLAKIRRATGDRRLNEPLTRAVDFARAFLHPDGTYGGVYGSRGTAHFYPHGFELLAAENVSAAELADGFLRNLAGRTESRLDDDRLYVHRVANLLEAYRDWSPTAPAGPRSAEPTARRFPRASLFVHRSPEAYTVVSTARGGVFEHFVGASDCSTDAGLIVETTDGRVAVSQTHDRSRAVDCRPAAEAAGEWLTVAGPLCYVRFEMMRPGKQMLLHAVMCTVGRWCRTLVRRLLQRRLITGRSEAPIRLTRRFEWDKGVGGPCSMTIDGNGTALGEQRLLTPLFRVTDTIELTNARVQVRRMSFGTDHESAYVAATGGYEPGILEPWTDLAEYVERLNRDRRVTITRQW